jgi:hypothetical protein
MPDSSDVTQCAQDAFEDAHTHLDADLAEATTPELTRAVLDNHDAALAKYTEALRTAFSCSNPEWEQALSDARAAKQAVDDARQAAVDLAGRIGGMAALTQSVADLVDAAK